MTSGAAPVGRTRFTTSGTVLLHIDFLLTGIVMTFLGPMLPILAARWSLNDSAAGALIFGLILLLLCLVLSRFSPDTRMHISQSPVAGTASSLPMLLLICALFFIYVGTETSFGGWVATYAHRMSLGESTLWALTPSFFWGS